MNESSQDRRDRGNTYAGMFIGAGATYGGMKAHNYVKANGGYGSAFSKATAKAKDLAGLIRPR